jgi:hypothetical protein
MLLRRGSLRPAARDCVVELLMYRAVHLPLVSNAHDDDPYGRDAAVPLAAKLFNSDKVVGLLS